MQLGMVGLGRMGANLVRRVMRGGHSTVVFDVNISSVEELVAEGAQGAVSLAELVENMESPRAVWIMVPAALTQKVVTDLAALMSPGDIIIDGGNSFYRDDIDRAASLKDLGIHYVDVGTSGGVFGLERGFCLMIGGEAHIVESLTPIFETLAPGAAAAPRTEGKSGELSTAEQGFLHCGPHGAGHFVKMVHNGIEYGMMAAFAEGLNVLSRAGIGASGQTHDAETAPLHASEYYQFDFDLAEVTEVWRRGSVVASWLLDLTAAALHEDPVMEGFSGNVSDSGEGRWTVHAAIDLGVPAHTITAALYERFASQGNAALGDRVLSAMRKQFGGHQEKPSTP